MGSREYQNFLKKLRNRCNKFGAKGILITKNPEGTITLHSPRWEDTISLDTRMAKNIIHIGHFRLQNNLSLASMEVNSTEKIIVSNHILNRRFSEFSSTDFLVKLCLVSAIIVLLLALVFYLLGGKSAGSVNYTYTGNFSSNSVINWVHMAIIGGFLLLFYFFARSMRKDVDKDLSQDN